MKRLVKKNQIMITALALMIAVAGYLNFSGKIFGGEAAEAGKQGAETDLLDISLEDSPDVTEKPGEAVLTNGNAIIAEAKVTREQVRAANKETLLEIINNENISEDQKEAAISEMIAMTKVAEEEAAVETMLMTKGFTEAVVTITSTGVDVVVNSSEITDVSRAQIEDIVTRQTGVAPENIVINPMSE